MNLNKHLLLLHEDNLLKGIAGEGVAGHRVHTVLQCAATPLPIFNLEQAHQTQFYGRVWENLSLGYTIVEKCFALSESL